MKTREKILKPTTIIPQHLYVHRNADRDLHRSIEDMGRPAYVLVARQMGKTNLLVNAKRELEETTDVFVYLDLSNLFEDLREFLRGIIDTAIETHTTLLDNVGIDIRAARERETLPPHREHETELRRLLRAIPGKLVIFLDEIDALTRSAFSDQVFSQIRKTYFSRVNFSEYHRLTYVLSGVAEPNDLIKDPKLSPFNIGEKIYLSDFTNDEHLEFMRKANLDGIPQEAAQRIFYWAGGNPRITWDICSALEDLVISGGSISSSSVDGIVQQIYLTTYDHAPVDHIRSLVQSDAAIRDAIVQIRYGKGNDLSDIIKSRLYMAGIVGADVRNARIKNKIIDESLSDQWLRDIERRNVDLLALARARYQGGDYVGSIGYYEDYLRQNPLAAPAEAALVHYYMGLAYFSLGQFRKVVELLTAVELDKDPADLYYGRFALAGACYEKLGESDAAIRSFLQVLEGGDAAGNIRYEVLVNLSRVYLAVDHVAHRQEIIEYCSEVLQASATAEQRLGKVALDRLKYLAHLRLSRVYAHSAELNLARTHLEGAAALCPKAERPALLFAMARIEPSVDQRRELLANAVQTIIDLNAPVVDRADETQPLDPTGIADMIAACAELEQKHTFSLLLKHVLRSCRERAQGGDKLFGEALLALAEKKPSACVLAVDTVLEWRNLEIVDESVIFQCLRAGALADVSKGSRYFARYMSMLNGEHRPSSLDAVDWRILFFGAVRAIQRHDFAQARNIIGLADQYLNEGDSLAQEVLLVTSFVQMRLAEAEGDSTEQFECATRVKELAAELVRDARELPIFGNQGPRVFGDAADEFLRAERQRKLRHLRIGRNDWIVVRYADGKQVKSKFKKVESDLLAGTCDFLRRVEKGPRN